MKYFCVFSLAVASVFAADAPSPAGDWHGTLKPNDTLSFRLQLNVQQGADGQLKGTLYSLDQSAEGLPVSSAKMEANRLKLELPSIQGSYDGELAADGRTVKGTWSQAGKSWPFTWESGKFPVVVDEVAKTAAPLAGVWEGELETPGGKMRLRFTLKKDEKGQITGAADSLDQNAMGMPMSGILFKAPAFHFDLRGVGGQYDATVDEKTMVMKGTWKQGQFEAPLEWKKVN
jgi:hypothetical protein